MVGVSSDRQVGWVPDFLGAGRTLAVAWAAYLADAEVVSSADLAGVASSADFAGMAFPAVAGVASPAEFAGMAFPAIAGAAPLAVIEVASSNNSIEVAGSPSVCGSQCAYDCLIPDDCVSVPDVVVFPESVELGGGS